MRKLTLISYGLILSLFGCNSYNPTEENARTKITAIAVAEMAHIYEHNKFTSNFDDLGINLNPETKYYSYKFIVFDEQKIVQYAAVAKQMFLKSYTGATYFAKTHNEYTVKYIICESDNPTQKSPDKMKWIDYKVNCPNGYSLIE
ncbi:MAG: type IV pilin-like G/H family protein [Cyanobacteria bacterium J06621_15]